MPEIRRITPAVDEWFRVGLLSMVRADQAVDYDVFPHSAVDLDDGTIIHGMTFMLSLSEVPGEAHSCFYVARLDECSKALVVGIARKMFHRLMSEALLAAADVFETYAEVFGDS